jgi:hypothetical protein
LIKTRVGGLFVKYVFLTGTQKPPVFNASGAAELWRDKKARSRQDARKSFLFAPLRFAFRQRGSIPRICFWTERAGRDILLAWRESDVFMLNSSASRRGA